MQVPSWYWRRAMMMVLVCLVVLVALARGDGGVTRERHDEYLQRVRHQPQERHQPPQPPPRAPTRRGGLEFRPNQGDESRVVHAARALDDTTITLPTTTPPPNSQLLTSAAGKSVAGIFAALFVICGVLACFFGYRIIKIIVVVFGFVFGFLASYYIMTLFIWSTPTGAWVAMTVGIVVGAGLAAVCFFYHPFGIFLVGTQRERSRARELATLAH